MDIKVQAGSIRRLSVSTSNSKEAEIGSAVGRSALKAAGRFLNIIYSFALSTLGISDVEESQPIPAIEVTMLKSGTRDYDFNGPVQVTKISGSGALAGTLTVSAVNGIATFSDLSVTANDTYTVRFVSGTATYVETSFIVFERTVSFTQFQSHAVSVIVDPPITITATKNGGATDTDYTGVVSLAKSSGLGNITGTLSKSAVAGVASFDDLVFDQISSYAIIIRLDGADKAILFVDITSGAITVPTANLVQHLGKSDGLDIYENVYDDLWYVPDNVSGSKGRDVRPSKYYEFNGTAQSIRGYLPLIDSTDSWRYRAYFRSSNASTNVSFLFANYDNADATRTGIAVYFFGSGHPTYPGKIAVQIIGDLAINDRITVVSNDSIVDGSWKFIDISYDGSKLASGVSITVDGVTSTLTTLFDALTLSTSLRTEYSIGEPFGGSGGFASFDLAKPTFTLNGTNILRIPSEEGFGELACDAVSGYHGAIDLVGVASTDFHKNESSDTISSESNNNGSYLVPNLNGVDNFITFPVNAVYQTNNFTLDVVVGINTLTDAFWRIFYNNYSNDPSDRNGWAFYIASDNKWRFIQGINATTTEITELGTQTPREHIPYTVNLTKVGTLLTWSIDNGIDSPMTGSATVTENTIWNGSISPDPAIGTQWDYSTADWNTTLPFHGVVYKFNLNCGGTDVINIRGTDYTYNNEYYSTRIKNVASGAVSDGFWATSEAYIHIPLSDVIPTEDIFGNTPADNYVGQVRHDAVLRQMSTLKLDGVLNAYSSMNETLSPTDTLSLKWSCSLVSGTIGNNVPVLGSIEGSPEYTGFEVSMRPLAASLYPNAVVLNLINDWDILINRKALAVYWESLDVENWHEYELTYDGSGTPSGAVLKVDGVIVPQTAVAQDSLGALSYSSGFPYRIGDRGNSLSTLPAATLGYIDFKVNGVQKIFLPFEEVSGLTRYDTSVNKGHFTVDLRGSVESDSHVVVGKKKPYNQINGYGTAKTFDGSNSASIARNSIYELNNFEVDFKFVPQADWNTTFSVGQYYLASTKINGMMVRMRTSTSTLYLTVGDGSGTLYQYSLVDAGVAVGVPVAVNIKVYNGNYYMSINGGAVTSGAVPTIVYDNTKDVIFGYFLNSVTPAQYAYGTLYDFGYYQLDSGGSRIATLIDFDAVKQLSLPSSYVPADPNNVGFDVWGNALTWSGSSKTLNLGEALIDRNPGNAYDLASQGVPTTENITYAVITADQTRYYDLDGVEIKDMLVYSDVGGEPITPGSMTAGELTKHNEVRAYLDQ